MLYRFLQPTVCFYCQGTAAEIVRPLPVVAALFLPYGLTVLFTNPCGEHVPPQREAYLHRVLNERRYFVSKPRLPPAEKRKRAARSENPIFRFSVLSETLDSWAKILDDVVKAAIIGLPAVILFGTYSVGLRWFMVCSMITAIMAGAWGANALRHLAKKRKD
ncbi:Uncharacterised protein [Neisseria canis]|uniref:Uncharacterized protein n=1 Tax=Neisseria canis TaxID=493 RepID=A0A3S4NP97_9NEIS|nr:Uncharacterised protein [Neisseria canis]